MPIASDSTPTGLAVLPLMRNLSCPLPYLTLAAWISALLSGMAIESWAQSPARETSTTPAFTDKQFREQVEPLLRARCFSCHGPEDQQGGLRLDDRRRALLGGDTGKAILPGNSQASPLIHRVSAQDPDERMPPEGEGTPLTANEVDVLKRWIEGGAPIPLVQHDPRLQHWSFLPVQRPVIPAVVRSDWGRSPIDRFVLAKLEQQRLQPSPAADRDTLIRRVYLDLLGLLPSPAQVRAFRDDHQPGAYERMVDQVLASPHFGERWGRHWLDLARYADSDGYEKDRPRPFAWRYRSWIIDALNQDRPFDEFSIQQLAGDLVSTGKPSDRIATGFHRNTLHNTEGGIDPEEDRYKKTIDRTNTFGSIWLGLTIGCAQCHTHKYDPITQREYFSLFAYFNSMVEQDAVLPLPREQARLQREQARHRELVTAKQEQLRNYRQTNSQRLATLAGQFEASTMQWQVLSFIAASSQAGAEWEQLEDRSLRVSGVNQSSDTYEVTFQLSLRRLTALRLEVLADPSLPAQGPGRAKNGNFVLCDLSAELSDAEGEERIPVRFEAATATFSQSDWDVGKAINENPTDGWAVSPKFGQRHVAVFKVSPLQLSGQARLTVRMKHTYAGEAHNLGRFRFTATDMPGAPMLENPAPELLAIAQQETDARSPEQEATYGEFLKRLDPGYRGLADELERLKRKPPQLAGSKARTVVEAAEPQPTHVHRRGEFLEPGEQVTPAPLSVLAQNPESEKLDNRLQLARWLFGPRHPLTSRVTANRIWARLLGRGLVATVDDFGTQGSLPSHPQLLDWLAVELREHHWSVKHLIRTIVCSETYRQSSRGRPDLVERDPENQWLARQSRRRVEAEVIRDLALGAAGLLDHRIGGPSVRPPQPSEYASLTYANSAKWNVSRGGDRYRRGIYTFFQRTSPYPMFMLFDSPDANNCVVSRESSNTPLQSLTLWNDPVFVEVSQALGRRILMETPSTASDRQRCQQAVEICLGRTPDSMTLDVLEDYVASQRQELSLQSAQTISGSPEAEGSDENQRELATWILLARTLLNLDEFITRR